MLGVESLARAFELQAFDAHPASRGAFALNHELDVHVGPRTLEIDLACPPLRLAVEIDGSFHFHDVDAYRRDRRKDRVLQEAGFFVLRVLAEDVVTSLDEVVRTIHETMAFLREGKNR